MAYNIKTKDISLKAFKIRQITDIKQSETTFCSEFKNKLESSKNAFSRAMSINHEASNKEKNLISYYKFTEKPPSIFCLFMNIAASDNYEAFPEELLQKEKFSFDDIISCSNSDSSNICLNSFYFLLQNDLLIVNIPANRTPIDLQTYLNWFTDNTLLELIPILDTDNKQLNDIRSIIIEDKEIKKNPFKNSKQTENEDISIKGINLTEQIWNALKKLVVDNDSLNEINLSRFISAKLLIEFKKPKQMSKEDYNNALAIAIKPVSALEYYTFKDKLGKTITNGKDILKTKKVKIQMTKNDNLNEEELLQEMSKFAIEINQNEKKSI